MALFDKAITFTDIHLGLKNNSKQHNEDCLNFIKFMIDEAKKNNIKVCVFMGDYFHNRSNINIQTLNYGLQILQLLNDNFKKVYFLVGNHDMYHKNKRDITSINMAQVYENIEFINEITTFDDCTFIPFMIEDEYKLLPQLKSKYVFGHLELPGYLLNKMVEMPDHGKETDGSFSGCEYVFSGHFHKRQAKTTSKGTRVVYTGNCFPHNFSDTWDDARGVMILEHDKEPIFKSWDSAPKYRTFTLSELLTDPSYYLQDNTISKVQIDISITTDEISFIRDTFTKLYNIREFNVVTSKQNVSELIEDGVNFESTESVDEIVLQQIMEIDSPMFDKNLLIQIYRSL
ncbi:metallophosphoesterase [Escherichia coli]|uniref:metallophosphoesterase n=1 Tax=Escherichia coli TaxID=562 RepID=UPI002376DBBA|nr:metallophos domain-containing protein [Escherichia phage ph0011]